MSENEQSSETNLEIGVLTFIGSDIHVYHRPAGSRFAVGLRYLDIEDDFINFDSEDTDQETRQVAGPFLRYLFAQGKAESFYLGGALYRVTEKVECGGLRDEDSATGLFLGGGLMGNRRGRISYNIGLMLAPGLSLDVDNEICSSESDGELDLNASMAIVFN